jgi:hypothetical protein
MLVLPALNVSDHDVMLPNGTKLKAFMAMRQLRARAFNAPGTFVCVFV